MVVFRKNHRDANPNDPKIDADAYVEYVNTTWKFTSFVWTEKLSKLWLERRYLAILFLFFIDICPAWIVHF